ncbi:MAG: sensor histidine kinase [Lachnospiraceae bacterium]|jgi:signal transduction histidine kinase
MNKKQKRTTFLTAATIYIVGALFGCIFICFIPQHLERKNTDRFVRERILEYKSEDDVSNWSNSGVAVVLYDSSGSFRRFIGQGTAMMTMDLYYQSYKDVPKVINGEKVSRLYLFVEDYSSLGYCSRLYVGRRIVVEDEPYAFFWVQEHSDLPEIILVYILTYTVIFSIALVITAHGFNKQFSYVSLQRQYIDNITHELKTPVASVKAITELLSDNADVDEVSRNVYYGMILNEMNRQQRMIQEALTLSKLQSKVEKIKLACVDSHEIFDELKEKYEMLCDLAGIEFVVDESIDKMPRLHANAHQLRKTLYFLINNSLRYVPEGGRIFISANSTLRFTTICVEDNGEGIPQKALPYVFERFYRAGRTDEKSGSGLGLSIAKEIVLAMRGKIRIESEEGKGTKVFVTLENY